MKTRLPKFMVPLLMALSIFTMASFLEEPWNTILFVIAIPLLQQGFKLYKDKTGATLGKLANQGISLALAIIFTVLNGGFAGLGFPALPVWANDLILFISDILKFAGALLALIAASWGSLTALYEGIWDKLFVATSLATADKLEG